MSLVKYLSVAAFCFMFCGSMLLLPNLLGVLRYAFFKKSYSSIPFAGGVLASMGLFLLPGSRSFAWIPLIVDPGCAWLTVKLLLDWRKILQKPPGSGSAN